jgi:hypothetical protein
MSLVVALLRTVGAGPRVPLILNSTWIEAKVKTETVDAAASSSKYKQVLRSY